MIREAAAEVLPALCADCQIFIGDAIQKHGGADIKKVFDFYFENYPPTDAVGLLRAMSRRTRYLRAWNLFLEEYPLVLAPFMMRRASPGTRIISQPAFAISLMRGLQLDDQLSRSAAAIAPAGYHEGLALGPDHRATFQEDLTLDAAECLERVNGIQVHELWRRKGLR